MKLDLHCHINGNGPQNRLENARNNARMLIAAGGDGMMLGCHDWTAPDELHRHIDDEFGIVTIPGAEVTTDAGHMLALWIQEITPPIHGTAKGPVEVHSAIEEIHRQGGKAILSHPFGGEGSHWPWPERLEEIRNEIDGVEIRNYKALLRHNVAEFDWFKREPHWLLTSGSDCHPWEGDTVSPDYLTEYP